MRLVSYDDGGSWRCGIEGGSEVVPIEVALAHAGIGLRAQADSRFVGTRELLAVGGDQLRDLATTVEALWDSFDGAKLDRSRLRLGPPVWDPPKIICLGLNYRDHAEEAGLEAPATPIFFAKWANSLVGPYDAIVPPRATRKVDYEGELAVVIGRPARQIAVTDALEHVAGAMVFNDVSARDLQLASPTWMAGKAIDTFGPCGPALVLADEMPDLQALAVRTRVNGDTVQDGNTASMIFSVAESIAYLSEIMTLEVGDIVVTGTPAGVGFTRTPPRFLDTGDVVEVEIEGLGTLRNEIGAHYGE